MAPATRRDWSRGRAAAVFLGLSLLAAAGEKPLPVAAGRWIGDARESQGVDRLEIQVDSAAASAELTLPAWGLARVPLSAATSDAHGLDFTGVVDGESVQLRGSLEEGRWGGELARGSRTARFELRRLHDLGDAGWQPLLVGYRAEDGRRLGT